MKIDFINSSYRRFYDQHKLEILRAFDECASQGDFMLRRHTRDFEANLAKYIGTRFAVGVNSCTDAMFLSLKALGVGIGDEVITTSHTFIATIQAIVHTGATPILVDVEERNELMDIDLVGKAITKKTKAIISVHFHGRVVDMRKLYMLTENIRLNDEQEIYVIEDAAQALGASIDGKKAGSFGDTGCFSFNFPKLMGAYGDAGAVVTDNEELFKELLLLRNHWNITQGSVDLDKYPPPEVMGWGWKSRIDNIQAAILNVKFKYLGEMLRRRKEIANMYWGGLCDIEGLELPKYEDNEVVQEYNIKVEDNLKFKKFMEKNGVEVLVRDITPNHLLKGLDLLHFKLPVTENLAKGSCRLPCYPELENQEIKMVIDTVKKYYD